MHECMVRLCILLNSLLYICKSELRKSQSGIKGFFFATVTAISWLAAPAAGWLASDFAVLLILREISKIQRNPNRRHA